MFRRFWADAALVCPQILCLMSAYYKTIKTAGGGGFIDRQWEGGGVGEEEFSKKKNEKKNKTPSVYRLMQRVNLKGADLVKSL